MHSQLGQDVFVLDMLGGLRGGFFLDSGASDGVRSNNTLLLEESFGWKGICIEPNEALFAALVRNRTCKCLNCCLYDTEGTVDFLEANTLGGILEGYHPTHLEFVKKTYHVPCDEKGRPRTVKREARTIRSILRECGAPKVIDYWSLDTEGTELAILKTFPFDEYSFRVLTVEHNWLPVHDEIKAFLEGRGYKRIRGMGVDDCYMKGHGWAQPSWRSAAWSGCRDYGS